MQFNFAYKDKCQSDSLENTNIISLFDQDFENFEANNAFFYECIFHFQTLQNFQNEKFSKNNYERELNYINMYIKKNPSIIKILFNMNFFQVVEDIFLLHATLNIYDDIIFQIIDICSTCISIKYINSFFPLRLASIILQLIETNQSHEIIKSSLYFAFFLQNNPNCIQCQNYFNVVNALLCHNSLITNILEIEKQIWLHILHFKNYQNMSTSEASNLLYAIYSTISYLFLIKNDISNSSLLLGEIYFRIFEGLKMIKNNVIDTSFNEYSNVDLLSIAQSLLFLLYILITFDIEFIHNSSSLPFNQLLLEYIQIKSLSINNELILEIIKNIISLDDDYFNQHDLFISFECLLRDNLEINHNRTISTIQNEELIILIYEILSKNAKNKLYLKSKILRIECHDFFVQNENHSMVNNNSLLFKDEEEFFSLSSIFIILSIEMMKISSYSVKTALNDFLSTLYIYGGDSAIHEIIQKIDIDNQIVQFFYDFLVCCNGLEIDLSFDDWLIKQMKLAIKLFLIYISKFKNQELCCKLNFPLEELYKCFSDDDELLDIRKQI